MSLAVCFDANHDVDRVKFGIRVLFTALEGGQQQLKNGESAGHELMQGGFAVRAPGLGVGGSYLTTRDK